MKSCHIFNVLLMLIVVISLVMTLDTDCYFQDIKIPNCTQLHSNVNMDLEFNVTKGEYHDFFWVLEDFSEVAELDEFLFGIQMSPCVGLPYLYVLPGIAGRFPRQDDTETIKSEREYSDNVITMDPTYGSFYISVYGKEDSLFKLLIFVVTDSMDIISTATNEDVTVISLDNDIVPLDQTVSSKITYKSLNLKGVQYSVYSVEHSKRDDDCSMSKKASNPGNCIIKSICGISRVENIKYYENNTEYEPGKEINIVVDDLVQTLNYTFNVLIKLPEGIFLAYGGAEGKPESPDNSPEGASSPVTLIFLIVLGLIIVGTIIGIVLLKRQVLKKIR